MIKVAMYWRLRKMFVLLKFVIVSKVTFAFEQMSAIGSCHISRPVKMSFFVFIFRFFPITFISWNNALITQVVLNSLSCSVSIQAITAMI